MIEIKNKINGDVLKAVDADTLVKADLFSANLFHADLINADLRDANLAGADLRDVDLINANLNGANLYATNLSYAQLSGADLTNVELRLTIFAWCWDLHKAKGLETIRHSGRSALDAETLRTNIEHLPDVFLRGVGYSVEEIETLRGLYGKAFRFYSCFISYARADDEFASRLYSDLQTNNVTCWKDTEDLKGGLHWRSQITEAIRLKDKLVVVCSEKSVTKPNVIYEIVKGIELEEKTGVKKLFPIRIDDFIFSDELEEMADRETSRGEWPRNWLSKVRAYHVSDFRGWEDHKRYKPAFERLLKDLKQV